VVRTLQHVHFDLSADQRALADAAAGLLDKATDVRAFLGQAWDPTLWASMVEQGWAGVALPEDDGGLGLGWVEAVVLAEQLGRHVAPAPFTSTVLALAALGGHPLTEAVVAGETTLTVARAGELGVDAPSASYAVVIGSDVRLHEISGVAAEASMDVTRQVGWVRPDGEGELLAIDAQRMLDIAAVLISGEILGLAGRMLEVSVDYAKVREQFGRPIGSFQAVKHRLADMLVDVEGIRSAVWYAAWALDVDAPDRSLAASAAKAWASEAGQRVMSSALQVHGGIGFTWEHDLHLYSKRCQLDSVQFGTAAWHRERIAGLLAGRVRAGVEIF
jgi:alkylation response protein AidB-like acyl-CoA dehydrogenase